MNIWIDHVANIPNSFQHDSQLERSQKPVLLHLKDLCLYSFWKIQKQ